MQSEASLRTLTGTTVPHKLRLNRLRSKLFMDKRAAISKEEAEFEKLVAAALERERQKLRALTEAHESQKCGSFEDPE